MLDGCMKYFFIGISLLLLLVACRVPVADDADLAVVFGVSAIATDKQVYSPQELVNISIMVRNERLLNYTFNITLLRDGRVDYQQSSLRESVVRSYERWNVWTELPETGECAVLVELQPESSSYVVNASTIFTVK